MAFQFFPGATAIGISYSDGIILAAEKRVSYGNFVVNKNTKKVFPVTEYVGAACAGMIADMQVLVRQVSALAKIMSVIMFERRYFPLLTQVVIGGVEYRPQIYTLDPLGSVLPDDYAAVGSGAEMALGVMDAEYTQGMSDEKARDLVVQAIKSSIQRDSSSGDGIDLLTITKDNLREDLLAVK